MKFSHASFSCAFCLIKKISLDLEFCVDRMEFGLLAEFFLKRREVNNTRSNLLGDPFHLLHAQLIR